MNKLTLSVIIYIITSNLSFAQFPNITFTNGGWTSNANVVLDLPGNKATITGNGSNFQRTEKITTITTPPNDYYFLVDVFLQNVTPDIGTIKNPVINLRDNSTNSLIDRINLNNPFLNQWFTTGIRLKNSLVTNFKIEIGMNGILGTMIVSNPRFSTTFPTFTYDFPFTVPTNPSASINVNTTQFHPFENDLLSTNSHFVYAGLQWGDAELNTIINSKFPMTNLRFPGGTVGNYYNYQTDTFFTNTHTPNNLLNIQQSGYLFNYQGYRDLVVNSGATSTLMFNLITPTVTESKNEFIARKNSGLPIKWIEFGNEMFFTENLSGNNITDVNTYASHCQQLSSQIKAVDPLAKVAICIDKDDYTNSSWNTTLSQNQSYYDACVVHNYNAVSSYFPNKYHMYVALNGYRTTRNRINNFKLKFPTKSLILTEWGITTDVELPYFVQALGLADMFLAMEKGNEEGVVKQAGLHMLYKNDQKHESTLFYKSGLNTILSSNGVFYSKLFDIFKNATVYNAEAESPLLETDLKSVYAKMTKKDGKYKLFIVNKLPVTVPFNILFDHVPYTGLYQIETYSENMSNPTNGSNINNNPWSTTNLTGTPQISPSSITVITINETDLAQTLNTTVWIDLDNTGPQPASWTKGTPVSNTTNAIIKSYYDGNENLPLTVNKIEIENNTVLKNTLDVKSNLNLITGELNLNTGSLVILRGNANIEGNGVTSNLFATTEFRVNGTGLHTIFGTKKLQLNNLTLTGSSTLTANTAIDIHLKLKLNTGCILNTNNNITLKGSAVDIKTAFLDIFPTTATINGDVIVEKYINAVNNRAWHAVTVPFIQGDANATVFSNWQNNGTIVPNYGVEIWGPTGSTTPTTNPNGLAVGPNYSLLSYNAGWQSILNTKTTNLYTSTTNIPYLLFVSGAFENGLGNINPVTGSESTVIRSKGKLQTGDKTYSTITNSTHTFIGNPYACPVDLDLAISTSSSGLVPGYWVWDPTLANTGAYVTYDINLNQFSNTLGVYSDINLKGVIQSGQAFFVKGTTTNGTLTITENNKKTTRTFISNYARSTDVSNPTILKVNILKENNGLWKSYDGCIKGLYSSANVSVDDLDIPKTISSTENVFFRNGTTDLVSEHTQLPTTSAIYPISTSNLQNTNYKLKVSFENFTENLTPKLRDLQTNFVTTIPLDENGLEYSFVSTSTDIQNRFEVIFEQNLSNELYSNNEFKVYPNPCTSEIKIDLPENISNSNYTIFDVTGKMVLKGIYNKDEKINTSNLNSGTYLIEINHENLYETIQLIKK